MRWNRLTILTDRLNPTMEEYRSNIHIHVLHLSVLVIMMCSLVTVTSCHPKMERSCHGRKECFVQTVLIVQTGICIYMVVSHYHYNMFRTNVVQSLLARKSLSAQLKVWIQLLHQTVYAICMVSSDSTHIQLFGVLHPSENLENKKEFESTFKNGILLDYITRIVVNNSY